MGLPMAATVKSWGWRRPHHLVCSTSGNCPTRPQRPKWSPLACLLAKSPISSHWRERTRWVGETDWTRCSCKNHKIIIRFQFYILEFIQDKQGVGGMVTTVRFIFLFFFFFFSWSLVVKSFFHFHLSRTRCHTRTLDSFRPSIWNRPTAPYKSLLSGCRGGP